MEENSHRNDITAPKNLHKRCPPMKKVTRVGGGWGSVSPMKNDGGGKVSLALQLDHEIMGEAWSLRCSHDEKREKKNRQGKRRAMLRRETERERERWKGT